MLPVVKIILPGFKTPDVKRISKHLGMKESVFIETYLRVDQDGDFVVKSYSLSLPWIR